MLLELTIICLAVTVLAVSSAAAFAVPSVAVLHVRRDDRLQGATSRVPLLAAPTPAVRFDGGLP